MKISPHTGLWHRFAVEESKVIPNELVLKAKEFKNQIFGALIEERFGEHQLTPLHACLLEGNYPMMDFLLSQGAWLSRMDRTGNSVETLEANKEQLAHLYAQPRCINRIGKIFLRQFMKEHVAPVELAQEYVKNTDDFGVKIKRLLHDDVNAYYNGLTITSMKDVCNYLGIEFALSKTSGFARDHWFRHPNGKVYGHQENSLVKEVSSQVGSKSATLNQDGGAFHPIKDIQSLLGAVGVTPTCKEEKDTYFPDVQQAIPYYGEGGNQFVLTNKAKEPSLLIGRLQRDFTHLILRKDASFKKEAEAKKMEAPSQEKIMRTLHEMYAQDLLKVEKKGGMLNDSEWKKVYSYFNKVRLDNWPLWEKVPLMGEVIRRIKPFPANQFLINGAYNSAINYLKQKNLVKERIASHYQIPPKNVVFLPNIFYHLDMFLLPGPGHSVFLNDFDLTVKLLKFLKEKADTWELTTKDLESLNTLILSTEGYALRMKPLFEKIKKKLDKANIHYIPTPGMFCFDDQKAYKKDLDYVGYNRTFLNAVTGFSDKTNRFFYITERLRIGDHLGELLMDAYTAFLQSIMPIDAIFVAHHTDLMAFRGRYHQNDYGLHCMTFPLETESKKQN